jgi:hypothetical protein
MFWMKISKRTPKKKKNKNTWLTEGLVKMVLAQHFFLGLLGTIVPTSGGWQKPLAKFNTYS